MTSPWTDFLARQGAAIDDTPPHAVRFDSDPPAEPATLVVPLLHLGTIRASGEDSASFLHNLFSNDVKSLGDDGAQWNSFNSPKGRMLASFLIWRTEDGHGLALSADILPALLKKLSMYVLRSKVRLVDGGDAFALLGVTGPDASTVLEKAGVAVPQADMTQTTRDAGNIRCIRLHSTAFVLVAGAETAAERFEAVRDAGAVVAGTEAWQLAMIRAGVPLVTAATQEEFVAQMLNFELIGGVNFKKGCYPGQEIVARSQYLGKIKKRMYRVRIAADAAPSVGMDVYTPGFGEQSAGKLVNVARTAAGGFEALAVLQNSCAEGGEVHLGAPDGPLLSILDLPYSLPA